MISVESSEMQIRNLKIESLSYSCYEKLISFCEPCLVNRMLAIPKRVSNIGEIDGIAYAYINNMESAIRTCLTNNLGDVLGICVLHDIDFTMGTCSAFCKSFSIKGNDYLDLFLHNISKWARENAGLIISNQDDFLLKEEFKRYSIPVEIPNYCIDRIVNELEKKTVIEYFDKYMFSPISRNKDRENIYHRMMAAADILLAYNKSPIGFVSFYANDTQNRIAFISSIAVSDSCRGAGVGSALLEQCKKISIIRGMVTLELKVNKGNTKAIRFYSRQGFLKKDTESKNEYTMVLELQ